jgi:predicted AlkP superfamily pyrophosphatase or phosphodiesterase
VSAELTPTVWQLGLEGGRAPDGGRGVMTASTYPNRATFMTGVGPDMHHIVTSKAWVEGELRPAAQVGPAASTLFDDCREAGLRSVGVFGDQHLVGVCGARAADAHWPPDGVLPDESSRGRLGCGADRAVVAAVDTVEIAEADLVVLQLDETDTARHLHGPDTAAALAECRATDAALGEILERLRPHWDQTVVIVVSDHDNEAVAPGAIDLHAEAQRRELDVHIEHDGTACMC